MNLKMINEKQKIIKQEEKENLHKTRNFSFKTFLGKYSAISFTPYLVFI